MKVFLDDERDTPQGWHRVFWPDEAIQLLESGAVDEISLDHDLGDDRRGTGYDVIVWIEEAVASRGFTPPRITVHSANPSARERMLAGVESILRLSRLQQSAVARAAGWIAEATGILVTAGAGMGVDSGLPDFRGDAGFWRTYPALGAARIHFASIATPAAILRKPEIAGGVFGHLLNLCRQAEPHAGFELLRRWIATKRDGGAVFTSNVDSAFQRAGFDPALIVECHGTLAKMQCTLPCSDATWSSDSLAPVVDEEGCTLLSALPECPDCGRLARPNVLLFDDYLWNGDEYREAFTRLTAWARTVERLVVIELGAGHAIPTVREFSQLVVHEHGAHLVRINPLDFEVDGPRAQGLPMGALDGLQRIARWIDRPVSMEGRFAK